jgi:hypothetical protein
LQVLFHYIGEFRRPVARRITLSVAPLDQIVDYRGIIVGGNQVASQADEKRTSVQNGLYFFMWLGAGLLVTLGASIAFAVLTDLKEKLGKR